jgi:hypothetical protein
MSSERTLERTLERMVGAIGFEFWCRCSFNNIESAAGTVKQWKTVVSSANGSQTDHNASVAKRCTTHSNCQRLTRPLDYFIAPSQAMLV